jgi:hypothetical protein
MKKYLLCAMLGLGMSLLAQQNEGSAKPKKEKLESMKIAYLTKELALNPKEAEQFWPIYNEMIEKVRQNRKEKRMLTKELKEHASTLKEEEIKQKMEALFQKQIEEINLKKNYGEKIAGVIGYQKALKLTVLEHQFRQEVINQLKKKQQQPSSLPKE